MYEIIKTRKIYVLLLLLKCHFMLQMLITLSGVGLSDALLQYHDNVCAANQ